MSTWTDIRDDYVKPVLGGVLTEDVVGGLTGEKAAEAAEEAAKIQRQGIEYAAQLEQQRYEQSRADQMPWLEAGERALTELETRMGQEPSFADYQQSDYSKFIQEQGLGALEAKGRAGGYFQTGATSKDMMQYAQDIAGQDYQQYLGNYYQSLNPYMQLATGGQAQATTMGQQGMQSAAQQGAYATQSAQSQAQAEMAAANAQTQGIQNLAGLGLTAGLYAMGGPVAATVGGMAMQGGTPYTVNYPSQMGQTVNPYMVA